MIANILFMLLGALLGIAAMALVQINRTENYDEPTDSEMFDFITRNDLGLSVIKRGDSLAMWGVTTAIPVKCIGALMDDPRDAVIGAMELMGEADRG